MSFIVKNLSKGRSLIQQSSLAAWLWPSWISWGRQSYKLTNESNCQTADSTNFHLVACCALIMPHEAHLWFWWCKFPGLQTATLNWWNCLTIKGPNSKCIASFCLQSPPISCTLYDLALNHKSRFIDARHGSYSKRKVEERKDKIREMKTNRILDGLTKIPWRVFASEQPLEESGPKVVKCIIVHQVNASVKLSYAICK